MKFFVVASFLVAAAYAEADADPYYAAYGYAGHPVAYAGIKSAPCVNSANLPVPCAGGVANGYAYGAYGYPYASAYAGYPYGIYGRKKREAEAQQPWQSSWIQSPSRGSFLLMFSETSETAVS